MSQENVQIIRRSFELFLAGEREQWIETIHPDVSWDFSPAPLPDVPNSGRGRDAFVEALGTYFSGWNDYEAEVVELIDAGKQVIAVVHETARMRRTDAFLDRDLIHLWTVAAGGGAFVRIFLRKAEALEAAGLSE